MMVYKRTDKNDADFLALVVMLEADLSKRYEKSGESNDPYAALNSLQNVAAAVIAYDDHEPVACGAFKPFAEDAVEIKRVFVKPSFRGRGISKGVLKELETWAAEMDYRRAVLETGKRQPEAISLYSRIGYHIINNYGPYAELPNSVCFEKLLAGEG